MRCGINVAMALNREIAVSLVRSHEEAGSPSFPRVRDLLRDKIGDPVPTTEWIRRWHTPGKEPTDSTNLDARLAVGFALVYNRRLRDLHPNLEGQVERFEQALQELHDRDAARLDGGPETDVSGGGGPTVRPFRRRRSPAA
jgi:hypothetical protein